MHLDGLGELLTGLLEGFIELASPRPKRLLRKPRRWRLAVILLVAAAAVGIVLAC
jgi:hypothetical protein